jgi:hypothetical protein
VLSELITRKEMNEELAKLKKELLDKIAQSDSIMRNRTDPRNFDYNTGR